VKNEIEKSQNIIPQKLFVKKMSVKIEFVVQEFMPSVFCASYFFRNMKLLLLKKRKQNFRTNMKLQLKVTFVGANTERFKDQISERRKKR